MSETKFDAEAVKNRIERDLQDAVDSSVERLTAREAMRRLASAVSNMIDRNLESFRRDLGIREKVLSLEKAACVTVVAEYQKRIAELESKLKEK